jgi:hypothetical protein
MKIDDAWTQVLIVCVSQNTVVNGSTSKPDPWIGLFVFVRFLHASREARHCCPRPHPTRRIPFIGTVSVVTLYAFAFPIARQGRRSYRCARGIRKVRLMAAQGTGQLALPAADQR